MQPKHYEALLESARAKVAGNQGFYAIDDAQRAAALQPSDWRPVSLLAVALSQSERDQEALAAHQKALALAPNNPATLTNLGMYYADARRAAEAEPLLRKAAAAPAPAPRSARTWRWCWAGGPLRRGRAGWSARTCRPPPWTATSPTCTPRPMPSVRTRGFAARDSVEFAAGLRRPAKRIPLRPRNQIPLLPLGQRSGAGLRDEGGRFKP